MAQTFFIRLILVGHADLLCEVREADSDRLQRVLDSDNQAASFFWFDTIDGRSVIVNLAYLQGARFLWDVASAPPDSRRSDDHLMHIVLSGQDPISESPSEDPSEVYTLFWLLELGGRRVVTYNDADGEDFAIVADQIVYISAPKDIVDLGRKMVEDEGGA